MNKYNTLLSSIKAFFDVNDTLRKELNNIAIEEHGKSLNDLLILWAKKNSTLNNDTYIELVEYLNGPDCISDMAEMYDFIYDFEV